MTQVLLMPGELACLLQGISATSIVGSYRDLLFPEDEGARARLIQEGALSMAQPDWLERVAGGQAGYTDLMLYVAVIASPETVLEAIRNTPDGGRQIVTYYLAQGVVVELVLLADDRFQLTELASLDVASARIAASWALSGSAGGASGAATLPRDAISDVDRLVADGQADQARRLLQTQGIDDPTIGALLDASQAEPVEVISLLRFQAGQYVPTWRLLLYETSHGVWAVENSAAAREQISVASLRTIDLAQSVRQALEDSANGFK